MQVLIRREVSEEQERDMTQRLVSAIAEELWGLNGGGGGFNWPEAERRLRRIVGEARACRTAVVSVAAPWMGLGAPEPPAADLRRAGRALAAAGGGRRSGAMVAVDRQSDVAGHSRGKVDGGEW
jgi:hypothetical protein